MKTPVRVAVIGLGGFAQAHHRALVNLEADGTCRLVCASGRNPARYGSFLAELGFERRGVRVFSSHIEMLDACRSELDMVIVPTPIHLHADMHRDVVERGLACYLEKPPTLDCRELEDMLKVESRATRATLVGFNMVGDPLRLALKERLVRGDFGALRRVTFLGNSPRFTPYYARADWAGKIAVDGHLVLDSCIGNALAHNVHNLCLWSGTDAVLSWAGIRDVAAELYRGHAVENFDTVFAQVSCQNGVELRLAASHACDMPNRHVETVACERAEIEWWVGRSVTIRWKDGRAESLAMDPQGGSLESCLRHYAGYIRGDHPRPLTTLADCRPYVQLFDLVYVAAGDMQVVVPEHIVRKEEKPGEESVAIRGVTEACETFVRTAAFPSAKPWPWAKAGGRAAVKDLVRFGEVIDRFRKAYGKSDRA